MTSVTSRKNRSEECKPEQVAEHKQLGEKVMDHHDIDKTMADDESTTPVGEESMAKRNEQSNG